jgi:ppGpp synthetase/RelA/SpoT-type nucleotidyltranferase
MTDHDASLSEQVGAQIERLRRHQATLDMVRKDIERLIVARVAEAWRADGRHSEPSVYSRTKAAGSVRRRVEERDLVLEDLPDLIGVRVLVLHRGEIDLVESALEPFRRLAKREESRHFQQVGRASGYAGIAYMKIPLSTTLRSAARRRGTEQDPAVQACISEVGHLHWELQIHTAMQEAWSRLSHARFYKDQQGVPFPSWLALQRLAAVVDLVDEQLSRIDSGVEVERGRAQDLIRRADSRDAVHLDEYVLSLTQNIWDDRLAELRDLGRAAGFRVSEWPELVRVGDETELCLGVFRATGAPTVGQLTQYVDLVLSQWDRYVDRLLTVFRAPPDPLESMTDPATDDTELVVYDRPLAVVSYARLMDYPQYIESVRLRPSIRRQLLRARRYGLAGMSP